MGRRPAPSAVTGVLAGVGEAVAALDSSDDGVRCAVLFVDVVVMVSLSFWFADVRLRGVVDLDRVDVAFSPLAFEAPFFFEAVLRFELSVVD
jgi:hypothetical protein